VRLIDEPLATAFAYRNVSNPVRRAGVYDLGGGTFDFSVVDWTRGTTRLIACDSDLAVGGDDIDHLLAEWVAEEVLKQLNWDLRGYAEVYARLVAECERAKIRLSFFDETLLDLSQIDPDGLGSSEGMPLRCDVLNRISEGLVQRTFVTCDSVLRNAGLRASDLDAVFMAGGSTYLSKVREDVHSYFGMPGRFELEPTEVVALGSSQMASSFEEQ
jgi:molecular chaperone DnaK